MKYDVAILGGGPGGYVCSIRMSQLGFKTVLIEEKDLGGTCLNRGCIPTKALLHSSEVYQEVMKAATYGVNVSEISFDYGVMSKRKDGIVDNLRRGVAGILKSHGVTVIKSRGWLTGDTSIALANGETIEASTIVLATGSIPAHPPIEGIETQGVMDSDGALALSELPESVVIVGGGVIGVEFASLYANLGVQVTIIEMLDTILAPLDEEIIDRMRVDLEKKGIVFHTRSTVKSIRKGLEIIAVSVDRGEYSVQAEICIIASGRKPLTQNIGLESVGILIDRKGYIQTDGFMRTNIPNIYAIGDITGEVQLAHAASAQGLLVAEYLYGNKCKPIDSKEIPSCIYTQPEMAMIGLTENQVKESNRPYKVGRFDLAGNGKAMTMGENKGFIKIIADEATGEIYGAHLYGPGVTEMIGEIVTLMKSEGTIDEIAHGIHPHPTVNEAIMEAAQDWDGMSVHKFKIQ